MMAALMQGSQDDFVGQLVNAMPHVTVSDERRLPPPQPAETAFAAAEIHGLTPEARRPGIKNPLAIMAALEAWVPGAIAPSVKVQAILRYAARDVGATVIGIDPHREAQGVDAADADAQGTLASLYRATNAVIIGDRLAQKHRRARRRQHHGADQRRRPPHRAGGRPLPYRRAAGRRRHRLRAGEDRRRSSPSRPGSSTRSSVRSTIRWRRATSRNASSGRPATSRSPGRRRTRICSTPSLIRNVIMYTVVGAILLVASFGTYNIISTITHEKARDIAIMKSLGLPEATVRCDLRAGGDDDRRGRRRRRLRARLRPVPGARHGRDQATRSSTSSRLPLAYSAWHYALAGWWRSCRRSPPATRRRARRRASIRSTSSGGRHDPRRRAPARR